MSTAKDEVKEVLENLPDDTTIEDIQYHLYVKNKIDSGLNDLEDDNTFTDEEVKKRMKRWTER